MAKRRTIGENPLDGLIQPAAVNNDYPKMFAEEEHVTQKSSRQTKQRITVQISVDIIERIKNAVYWTPGLTLAALAEEAFSTAVDKLEKKKGESFPHRKNELKTGRPIK